MPNSLEIAEKAIKDFSRVQDNMFLAKKENAIEKGLYIIKSIVSICRRKYYRNRYD